MGQCAPPPGVLPCLPLATPTGNGVPGDAVHGPEQSGVQVADGKGPCLPGEVSSGEGAGCWKDPNGGWGVGEGRDWRKAG